MIYQFSLHWLERISNITKLKTQGQCDVQMKENCFNYTRNRMNLNSHSVSFRRNSAINVHMPQIPRTDVNS